MRTKETPSLFCLGEGCVKLNVWEMESTMKNGKREAPFHEKQGHFRGPGIETLIFGAGVEGRG